MHKIFQYIKEGRYASVGALVSQDNECIFEVDILYRTPLHIAFIYKRYDIALMILNVDPIMAKSIIKFTDANNLSPLAYYKYRKIKTYYDMYMFREIDKKIIRLISMG